MIKKILLLVIALISILGFSQKNQKIGYLDMEYILENVPEYTGAQSKLDAKINTWNTKLDAIKSNIEKMTSDLNNEKALLTDDLIAEREEDIQIKKEEFKQLQEQYFGPAGELFLLRKQIVKPVQDQIYNAVQEIAKTKKYDVIFDKSSDLLMLYSNKKYDVSELVLNKIVKGRKLKENKEKKENRIASNLSKQEQMKQKILDRKKKQQAIKDKIKKAQQERLRVKDSIRKAKTAERLERMNAVKNKQKASVKTPTVKKQQETTDSIENGDIKENTKNTAKDVKTTESSTTVEEKAKTPAQIRAEQKEKKRKELLARLANQKKKRDSLKNVAAEKRAKKLKEIEERKKKLQEQKNN